MGVLGFGPEQLRRLLELSFEADQNGYLFYRNRWARGVRVTAAEREAYLSGTGLGSRSAFYQAIRGRPAEAAPRQFAPVYWKLLSRLPVAMGVVALLYGLGLVARCWFPGSDLVRAILMIPGIGLIFFGASIIYAKWAKRAG